jgi:hypothetical protein
MQNIRSLHIGAAVMLVTAATAITGCGSSMKPQTSANATTTGTVTLTKGATLNSPRVAKAIERSILASRHLRATVSCPSNVPQRKGFHFVCLATTKSGQTPFVVTEVNGAGYVTYVGK